MRMFQHYPAALTFVIATGLASAPAPAIRVMLLDGANNHDWKATSPVIRKVLDEAGIFRTTTVTVDNGEVAGFKPDWKQFDAIVLNYNTGINADAPLWPAETRNAFQRYVSDGGGVVSVHAADNAFAVWPEFNEMIGVGGWGNRDEHAGPYWYYKDNALVKDEAPGAAGQMDARRRRTLRKAARSGAEHDHSRHRVLGADAPRRADPDRVDLRQGSNLPHDGRSRRRRHELAGFRRDTAAGDRVGGDWQSDCDR